MTGGGSRKDDPFSSHEAAQYVDVSALEDLVMDVLEKSGVWMTALEIAREVNMHPWSISPRMRPLWRKGLTEEGKKLCLNTAGKTRNMVAWRAKKVKP